MRKERIEAYLLADSGQLLVRNDVPKWMLLRVGATICGEVVGGVEPNLTGVPLIPMTLVASDREAAKKEMCRQLDNLWDAWEQK